MTFVKLTAALGLAVVCALPAAADTILNTGVGTGGPAVNAGQFEEQGWTQTVNYTDVDISVALYSWTPGEQFDIQAFLTNTINSATTPLASTTFSGSTPTTTPTAYLLFSGLTLPVGNYYVTLASTDFSPGGAVWAYQCPGTCAITQDTGVTLDTQQYADNQGHGVLDAIDPYESTFIDAAPPVNLTVTGIPLLPEPATMAMAGGALGLLALWKRRR